MAQWGLRFMLAQGEGRNKMIDEDTDRHPHGRRRLTSIVHRAAVLRELLGGVPPERMHASRILARVERAAQEDGPVTLHFADGTTHEL